MRHLIAIFLLLMLLTATSASARLSGSLITGEACGDITHITVSGATCTTGPCSWSIDRPEIASFSPDVPGNSGGSESPGQSSYTFTIYPHAAGQAAFTFTDDEGTSIARINIGASPPASIGLVAGPAGSIPTTGTEDKPISFTVLLNDQCGKLFTQVNPSFSNKILVNEEVTFFDFATYTEKTAVLYDAGTCSSNSYDARTCPNCVCVVQMSNTGTAGTIQSDSSILQKPNSAGEVPVTLRSYANAVRIKATFFLQDQAIRDANNNLIPDPSKGSSFITQEWTTELERPLRGFDVKLNPSYATALDIVNFELGVQALDKDGFATPEFANKVLISFEPQRGQTGVNVVTDSARCTRKTSTQFECTYAAARDYSNKYNFGINKPGPYLIRVSDGPATTEKTCNSVDTHSKVSGKYTRCADPAGTCKEPAATASSCKVIVPNNAIQQTTPFYVIRSPVKLGISAPNLPVENGNPWVMANVPFDLKITLLDENGQTVTGPTPDVTLSATSLSGFQLQFASGSPTCKIDALTGSCVIRITPTGGNADMSFLASATYFNKQLLADPPYTVKLYASQCAPFTITPQIKPATTPQDLPVEQNLLNPPASDIATANSRIGSSLLNSQSGPNVCWDSQPITGEICVNSERGMFKQPNAGLLCVKEFTFSPQVGNVISDHLGYNLIPDPKDYRSSLLNTFYHPRVLWGYGFSGMGSGLSTCSAGVSSGYQIDLRSQPQIITTCEGCGFFMNAKSVKDISLPPYPIRTDSRTGNFENPHVVKGPTGLFLLTADSNGQLQRYSFQQNSKAQREEIYPESSNDVRFSSPTSMINDRRGNIFVADKFNSLIQVFKVSDTDRNPAIARIGQIPLPSSNQPVLTIGTERQFIVSDDFDSNYDPQAAFPATAVYQPTGVAVDSYNKLYVAGLAKPGQKDGNALVIQIFNPDFTPLATLVVPYKDGSKFSSADISTDFVGRRIYVADGSGIIKQFNFERDTLDFSAGAGTKVRIPCRHLDNGCKTSGCNTEAKGGAFPNYIYPDKCTYDINSDTVTVETNGFTDESILNQLKCPSSCGGSSGGICSQSTGQGSITTGYCHYDRYAQTPLHDDQKFHSIRAIFYKKGYVFVLDKVTYKQRGFKNCWSWTCNSGNCIFGGTSNGCKDEDSSRTVTEFWLRVFWEEDNGVLTPVYNGLIRDRIDDLAQDYGWFFTAGRGTGEALGIKPGTDARGLYVDDDLTAWFVMQYGSGTTDVAYKIPMTLSKSSGHAACGARNPRDATCDNPNSGYRTDLLQTSASEPSDILVLPDLIKSTLSQGLYCEGCSDKGGISPDVCDKEQQRAARNPVASQPQSTTAPTSYNRLALNTEIRAHLRIDYPVTITDNCGRGTSRDVTITGYADANSNAMSAFVEGGLFWTVFSKPYRNNPDLRPPFTAPDLEYEALSSRLFAKHFVAVDTDYLRTFPSAFPIQANYKLWEASYRFNFDRYRNDYYNYEYLTTTINPYEDLPELNDRSSPLYDSDAVSLAPVAGLQPTTLEWDFPIQYSFFAIKQVPNPFHTYAPSQYYQAALANGQSGSISFCSDHINPAPIDPNQLTKPDDSVAVTITIEGTDAAGQKLAATYNTKDESRCGHRLRDGSTATAHPSWKTIDSISISAPQEDAIVNLAFSCVREDSADPSSQMKCDRVQFNLDSETPTFEADWFTLTHTSTFQYHYVKAGQTTTLLHSDEFFTIAADNFPPSGTPLTIRPLTQTGPLTLSLLGPSPTGSLQAGYAILRGQRVTDPLIGTVSGSPIMYVDNPSNQPATISMTITVRDAAGNEVPVELTRDIQPNSQAIFGADLPADTASIISIDFRPSAAGLLFRITGTNGAYCFTHSPYFYQSQQGCSIQLPATPYTLAGVERFQPAQSTVPVETGTSSKLFSGITTIRGQCIIPGQACAQIGDRFEVLSDPSYTIPLLDLAGNAEIDSPLWGGTEAYAVSATATHPLCCNTRELISTCGDFDPSSFDSQTGFSSRCSSPEGTCYTLDSTNHYVTRATADKNSCFILSADPFANTAACSSCPQGSTEMACQQFDATSEVNVKYSGCADPAATCSSPSTSVGDCIVTSQQPITCTDLDTSSKSGSTFTKCLRPYKADCTSPASTAAQCTLTNIQCNSLDRSTKQSDGFTSCSQPRGPCKDPDPTDTLSDCKVAVTCANEPDCSSQNFYINKGSTASIRVIARDASGSLISLQHNMGGSNTDQPEDLSSQQITKVYSYTISNAKGQIISLFAKPSDGTATLPIVQNIEMLTSQTTQGSGTEVDPPRAIGIISDNRASLAVITIEGLDGSGNPVTEQVTLQNGEGRTAQAFTSLLHIKIEGATQTPTDAQISLRCLERDSSDSTKCKLPQGTCADASCADATVTVTPGQPRNENIRLTTTPLSSAQPTILGSIFVTERTFSPRALQKADGIFLFANSDTARLKAKTDAALGRRAVRFIFYDRFANRFVWDQPFHFSLPTKLSLEVSPVRDTTDANLTHVTLITTLLYTPLEEGNQPPSKPLAGQPIFLYEYKLASSTYKREINDATAGSLSPCTCPCLPAGARNCRTTCSFDNQPACDPNAPNCPSGTLCISGRCLNKFGKLRDASPSLGECPSGSAGECPASGHICVNGKCEHPATPTGAAPDQSGAQITDAEGKAYFSYDVCGWGRHKAVALFCDGTVNYQTGSCDIWPEAIYAPSIDSKPYYSGGFPLNIGVLGILAPFLIVVAFLVWKITRKKS